MWCNIECNTGYGIYSDSMDEHIENLNLICEHANPQWNHDQIECSLIEIPNSISELISFTVDSNEGICGQTELTQKIQNELKLQLHEQLCEDQIDCEIVSDISLCRETDNSIEKNSVSKNNLTFYNIVKREINENVDASKNEKKVKSQIQINTYAKIVQPSGHWNDSRSNGVQYRKVSNGVQLCDI